MRPFRAAVIAVLLSCPAAASADEPAALAEARVLYNAGRYDPAIRAAAPIREQPEFADEAMLVTARSHLERYRLDGDPADLVSARQLLTTIQAGGLSPRDQVDLLVGLGQSLYLGDTFGAAAELFATALSRASLLGARDRLLLLDWWASAVDREAQTRAADRRATLFAEIGRRMDEELRLDPGSAVANYWLAVGARGEGDLDRAWDVAVAGWIRATFAPAATAAALREDLDRLMTQAIIPDRVRLRPPREQLDAIDSLRAEWERVKADWR